MSRLDHIADRIAEVSPDWEAQIVPADPNGQRVASAIADDHVALGVETIREGHLLHYGGARVVVAQNTSSRVLIGDHCYATGLCDVAASGDLSAIRTLAQLVADVATVDPASDSRDDERETAWQRATVDLGRD